MSESCPGCINAYLDRLNAEQSLRTQAQQKANETKIPQAITPGGQIVAYPTDQAVIEVILPGNKP